MLPNTGSVALALRAAVGERTFELRDAVFNVTGAAEVELRSNDSPEAQFLEQALPVGEYSVVLAAGWLLYESRAGDLVETPATLVSDNPQSFRIVDGVRTELNFRFEIDTGESTAATGAGTLEVAIEIAERQAGSLVFTELMANPAELADSAGEWFELLNVSDREMSLEGCTIERDAATAFTIATALRLTPGATATLSVSESPGFVPSYVYSGLSLPNSGTYTLGLRCDGTLLDSVAVDASTWPGGAGIATSLDPEASSAGGNDSDSSWCDATLAYNTDLGSPGAPNPVCE